MEHKCVQHNHLTSAYIVQARKLEQFAQRSE